MKGILIGDVGSTKAQWAWLGTDREITFNTTGYNPVMHEEDGLQTMLRSVHVQVPDKVSRIYYYGTGIVSQKAREFIIQNCTVFFNESEVSCESDMLAVARALSSGRKSIICILGTGSNSCLFNGKTIVQQIPSLGFPLGDEGSGADIGKACVRAFYYGTMPKKIRVSFEEVLPSDRAIFLERFHHHPAPNRFLAELVPVVMENANSEFIQTLLRECFISFIRRHVAPYQVALPVHFSGGVAHIFHQLLVDILAGENLTPGTIVKSPLTGLINYHKSQS